MKGAPKVHRGKSKLVQPTVTFSLDYHHVERKTVRIFQREAIFSFSFVTNAISVVDRNGSDLYKVSNLNSFSSDISLNQSRTIKYFAV
jgi:hypothetical protein